MDENKIKAIVSAIEGLKASEWARIKQQVDMLYCSQASKVTIGDLGLLEKNLQEEFRR